MLLKGGQGRGDDVRDFGQTASASPLGSVTVGQAAPDPKDLALEAMARENERLVASVARIEARLADDVARAREEARREAAAAHQSNDAKRLEVMAATLAAARESFEDVLSTSARTLAVQVAVAALGQLVDLRADDEEWLARVIQRRMARLDTGATVTLVLPANAEALASRLELGPDVGVRIDSAQSDGAARIELAMGEIPVSLADGWSRILAVIGTGDD